MSVFAAVVLFVSAAFNVWTWPTFFKRVTRDARAFDAEGRKTAFWWVHFWLLVIALVLAVAAATAGVLLLVA